MTSMPDLLPILGEFGLPGAIIAWQFFLLNGREKRIQELTDKLVDKTEKDVERFASNTVIMERIMAAVDMLSSQLREKR